MKNSLRNNLIIEERFNKIGKLVEKYLPFFSQWDKDVLEGNPFEHEWIDKAQSMTEQELSHFDALREYKLLDCKKWIELINQMNELTGFDQLPIKENNLELIGNLKKQHELTQLYQLLSQDQQKTAIDFGGGVGNLAYFLNRNLNMKVSVLEQDQKLIDKGHIKFKDFQDDINFIQAKVQNKKLRLNHFNANLAIGLHTCGDFACNMLRNCRENNIDTIINFGCCYSKIQHDDYNISKQSNKNIKLNQRALSVATLSFNSVPLEFFEFRKKIRNYKFSFYHWLFHKHDMIEFCSMSNARRSLYKLSFEEFTINTYDRYFPNLSKPEQQELVDFYYSDANSKFNHYLEAYYAIARYFGKLVETYLICDRAIYLKENGYKVEIKEVFDEKISPRNKAIIARRE